MVRPWRVVYSGARYHVTSRGNGRQRIFHSDDDYLRFQEQLGHCLEQDEVVLYSYCMMPNHYHLFIETPLGNIKRFMQRLNTSYSMYYRYKHSRPGHCLQGRYGAKLISGDDYIQALTRYIHLNPVKVKAFHAKTNTARIECLNNFRWSSYRGYVNKAYREDIIDYRWLDLTGRKTAAGKMSAYQRYVEQCAAMDDESFLDALGASRYAVGDDEFKEQAEKYINSQIKKKVVYGDVLEPWERAGVDAKLISGVVASIYHVDESDLREHGNCVGRAKAALVELCCRYSGMTQRAIAHMLGYKSETTVGKHRQRFKAVLSNSKKELKRFNKAAGKIERLVKSIV